MGKKKPRGEGGKKVKRQKVEGGENGSLNDRNNHLESKKGETDAKKKRQKDERDAKGQ